MCKLTLSVYVSILFITLITILPTYISYADQNIIVNPLSYNFGKVEIGITNTAFISISNMDGHLLEISDILFQSGGSSDFDFVSPPSLPIYISSMETIDVGIEFSPSSEGLHSDTLEINSNDPESPIVLVSLNGEGVTQETPPVSVADILAFFDASITDGTLFGEGHGNSAGGRLNALRNMLEAAGDLIEDGLIEEACQQLMDAYYRCDGLFPPPDFVSGPAASTLADMILDLVMSLSSE